MVRRLHLAETAEARAITPADDVATLARWPPWDILAVAGPNHETRPQLLDLVVAELASRGPWCERRTRPVRGMLANQGKSLLAFAEQVDEDVRALAEQWRVSGPTVRESIRTQQMAEQDPRRWQRETPLRQRLRGRYHAPSEAVEERTARVVRAGSLVEDVNSRPRSYFFLRRQRGPDYLELPRSHLNHRRFPRGEQGYRVGKSPAGVLSGESHAHRLELLGYRRFSRN